MQVKTGLHLDADLRVAVKLRHGGRPVISFKPVAAQFLHVGAVRAVAPAGILWLFEEAERLYALAHPGGLVLMYGYGEGGYVCHRCIPLPPSSRAKSRDSRRSCSSLARAALRSGITSVANCKDDPASCRQRHLAFREDRVACLLSDHDGWSVGVAADQRRHDRSVDDAQPIDAAYAQVVVQYRRFVGAHTAGADGGDKWSPPTPSPSR